MFCEKQVIQSSDDNYREQMEHVCKHIVKKFFDRGPCSGGGRASMVGFFFLPKTIGFVMDWVQGSRDLVESTPLP